MKLAPKIILLLLSVTLGVVALYAIVQNSRVSQKLYTDAKKMHEQMLSNVLGVLAKSIWELDKDISTRGMRPLFESETVFQIRIYDSYGNFFHGLQLVDLNNSNKNKKYDLLELKTDLGHQIGLSNLEKNKVNYDPVVSRMIAPIKNLGDNQYLLIGSLWWKELESTDPRFMGYVVMHYSTDYIKERLIEEQISLLILTLILSTVIILLTYLFLEFQLLSHIRQLMQMSLNVAAGNFFKIPLNTIQSKDEIASLKLNFNFMVDKIERNSNLIQGLSEASQEIVRCKRLQDISTVYKMYAAKLIHANHLDIWLDTSNDMSNEARGIRRLSDDKELEQNNTLFQRVTTTQELKEMLLTKGMVGIENNFVIPVHSTKNTFMGLVNIFFNENKQFGEEDFRAINNLNVSLSVAIESYWYAEKQKINANVARDLELASAVQDSIIENNIPKSDDFECSTYYKTASQCGGDWFGIYSLNQNMTLVLFGDVTGHGTPSALMTAVTRGAVDSIKYFIASGSLSINEHLPAKILDILNGCIFHSGQKIYFMTMVATLIDFSKEKIYAASAGHTPPALLFFENNMASVKFIYPNIGNRLGYSLETKYAAETFDFKRGQGIVFYTDGIIESENQSQKEYGMKKFKESLRRHAQLQTTEFIQQVIKDAFKFFAGTPPKDDIAMMVIKFLTEEEKSQKNLKSLEAA